MNIDKSNIHPETGVRYGVVYGGNVPALVHKITSAGTNHSYVAWRDSIIERLTEFIIERDVDGLETFVTGTLSIGRRPQPWLYDDIINEQFVKGDATFEDIVAVFDGLNFAADFHSEDPTCSYEDEDGNQFYLAHLGSNEVVWCNHTNRIVKVRRCCDTLPNAGDLDSKVEDFGDPDTVECYGVPVKYLSR